jgi:hypothetical protein
MTTFVYRGLEILPLVYPCHPASPEGGHNYDEGFHASVRIVEPEHSRDLPRSRVFSVQATRPFLNAGDARRAAIALAEHLIDLSPGGAALPDMPA